MCSSVQTFKLMCCLCVFSSAYLGVFITQRAVAEAQKSLKNALLVAHLIAVSVAYPVFKHTQDPLTFHFMLQREEKGKIKAVCLHLVGKRKHQPQNKTSAMKGGKANKWRLKDAENNCLFSLAFRWVSEECAGQPPLITCRACKQKQCSRVDVTLYLQVKAIE